MSRVLLAGLFKLTLLLGVTAPAFAAPVSEEQARIVAKNYLRHVVETFNRWDGNIPIIRSITPIQYNNTKVFWHLHLDPSGYLLVSTRDELSPVKVYSEQGIFDPARVNSLSAPESWIIPEQYQSVEAVSNPVKSTRLSPTSAVVDQIESAWRTFSQTPSESQRAAAVLPAEEVGPLITARWGQGDP